MRTLTTALRRDGKSAIWGFTLIELVVTISIIVLLVGLVAYVAVALAARGEGTRTQNTLTQLGMIVQEWELAAERKVSFGDNGSLGSDIYEIDAGVLVSGADWQLAQTQDFTRKYLAIIERPQQARDLLSKVEPKVLRRAKPNQPFDVPPTPPLPAQQPPAEGWLVVLDSWDHPILAVHPGRPHLGSLEMAGQAIDANDGTIRTPYEDRFGIAQNGAVYFVSAGPDGQYGNMSAAAGSLAFNQTQDNLYTTVPSKP